MKKTLSYFLIVCLICSIVPFELSFSMSKDVSCDRPITSMKFHCEETTINMSTACRVPRELCKILTFMNLIVTKLVKRTKPIRRPLINRTRCRKIIHFENNGELEDPNRYIKTNKKMLILFKVLAFY